MSNDQELKTENPFETNSLYSELWQSLHHWPSLYSNGGEVLHHMYCVIGNGYEWIDGRLQSLYREDDEKGESSGEPELPNLTMHEELAVKFEVDKRLRNHHVTFVRANTALLAKDIHRDWTSLYPISQYSHVADVPDDVQEDFLAGTRLCIELAYGVLLTVGSVRFYVDTQNVRQRHDSTRASVEILDESLTGIIERFGPNPLGVQSNGYRLWGCFREYCAFQAKFNKELAKALRVTKR